MHSGRKKVRLLKVLGISLLLLGLLAIAALTVLDICVRPALTKLLGYKCRMIAEKLISDAVYSRMTYEDGKYDDIISFTFDSSGKIAALNTNQAKINSLKALLTEAVNTGLDRLSEERVGISVGTLSGISYLYGSGSEISFSLEPKGTAETKLISSFKNSGINQTIHSIILEVEVSISPMLIGHYDDVNVKSQVLVAQTVLIGDVPDSYSNIILDEEYYSELADFDL